MRMPQQNVALHDSIKLAWTIANAEACRAGSTSLGPAWFLLAALRIVDDNFDEAAEALGLSSEELASVGAVVVQCRQMLGLSDEELTSIRRKLRQVLYEAGGEPVPIHRLHRSGESRYLFQKATWRAVKVEEYELTLFHLLAELLANLPEEAAGFFVGKSFSAVHPPSLPQSHTAPRSPLEAGSNEHPSTQAVSTMPAPVSRTPLRASTPALDEIGRDLTALAKKGRLSPVIGRRSEITKLARYLQRTSKRNVIITGDAGVGKTAVVEGLTQRLIGENVPEFLRALRVVQINVADLVSGTRYRGDMEERVQQIVKEATDDPNLVLFFDEIHLLVKTGGGGEPMDIANILKPALAREDFRCIGATTTEEFERYIKNDSAFMRRFQVLRLAEPSQEEALQICQEWARRIEEIQEVVIEAEAVEAAVSLSARLIPDRSLPDKAIDVLENAASFVKITSLSFSSALPTKVKPTVKREQIERMLEDQYGIKINHDAALQPAKVADVLGAELVGQQAAVAQLVESLSSLSIGKSDESRPLGVFLFAGPTGVGKTYAAQCLARALFGAGEKRIGRFNMNEYKERHDLARMIGAPPGFIGHDQQGALFRFLEANTGGLILLDEMEKAHPEIQDYFLQIFDQGRARDARGRWVDFRNQLFILTCNFAGDPGRERQIGFVPETDDSTQVSSKELDHLLARSFRPEFLARIDRVIAFRELSLEDYQQLFDDRLAELKQEVSAHYGAVVEVAEDVQRELCERADEQSEGARGFAREFERTLVAPLIEFIKAGSQGATVRVSMAAGRLLFQ